MPMAHVLAVIDFILQIFLVLFAIGLLVMALYDVIFTLRHAGDPTTTALNITATTINNPGFRENTQTGK